MPSTQCRYGSRYMHCSPTRTVFLLFRFPALPLHRMAFPLTLFRDRGRALNSDDRGGAGGAHVVAQTLRNRQRKPTEDLRAQMEEKENMMSGIQKDIAALVQSIKARAASSAKRSVVLRSPCEQLLES